MRRSDRQASAGPPILAEGDARNRIVLVSLLELSGAARQEAIRLVAASLGRDETPVFVTDDPDFSPLAAGQFLYEFLPSLQSQAQIASAAQWEHYLALRLRLLLRKWSPVRVVAAGKAFELYLQERGKSQ